MVSLTNFDQSIQWMVGDWKGAADHMASHSVSAPVPNFGHKSVYVCLLFDFGTIFQRYTNIGSTLFRLRAYIWEHIRECVCVFSSLFCVLDGSCLLFWVHASHTAASYCFIINYILKTRPIIYLNKYQIFIAIQLEAVQTILCVWRGRDGEREREAGMRVTQNANKCCTVICEQYYRLFGRHF